MRECALSQIYATTFGEAIMRMCNDFHPIIKPFVGYRKGVYSRVGLVYSFEQTIHSMN